MDYFLILQTLMVTVLAAAPASFWEPGRGAIGRECAYIVLIWCAIGAGLSIGTVGLWASEPPVAGPVGALGLFLWLRQLPAVRPAADHVLAPVSRSLGVPSPSTLSAVLFFTALPVGIILFFGLTAPPPPGQPIVERDNGYGLGMVGTAILFPTLLLVLPLVLSRTLRESADHTASSDEPKTDTQRRAASRGSGLLFLFAVAMFWAGADMAVSDDAVQPNGTEAAWFAEVSLALLVTGFLVGLWALLALVVHSTTPTVPSTASWGVIAYLFAEGAQLRLDETTLGQIVMAALFWVMAALFAGITLWSAWKHLTLASHASRARARSG